MFRGSSQAITGELKKEPKTRRLRELKDRVLAIKFESCLKARGLYLITFIDGMNDK